MNGIETSVADGVQCIRIARPEKKNALTARMYEEMTAALVAGDIDDAIAVHMFAGLPGVFSAGNDIGDFSSGLEGARAALHFIATLPHVRKPLIAAVDGIAVGVGTTLLFHCDLVYASSLAQFQTPFLDLGLVPEAGSSLLGPRLLGHAVAFELLVLGNALSAERALAAGLVNAIVPSADLESLAMESALRLARKPPKALAISRRLLRGDTAEISARIDEEARLFAARLASPEAQEAFAAFFQKRKPDFGRAGES